MWLPCTALDQAFHDREGSGTGYGTKVFAIMEKP
jgi:hypothetical protein